MSVEGSVRSGVNSAGTEVYAVAMKLSAVRRPYCERIDHQFVSPWRREIRIPFRYTQTRQETVNLNPTSLQTQQREAVVMPLPISMHAGQIFLLTKLLTATDLRFYDFQAGAPVETWRARP